MVQFEDIVVHNRNIGTLDSLITDETIIRTWPLSRLQSDLMQGLEVSFAQLVTMFLEDCYQTASV